jgi:hypothetical protein
MASESYVFYAYGLGTSLTHFGEMSHDSLRQGVRSCIAVQRLDGTRNEADQRPVRLVPALIPCGSSQPATCTARRHAKATCGRR